MNNGSACSHLGHWPNVQRMSDKAPSTTSMYSTFALMAMHIRCGCRGGTSATLFRRAHLFRRELLTLPFGILVPALSAGRSLGRRLDAIHRHDDCPKLKALSAGRVLG